MNKNIKRIAKTALIFLLPVAAMYVVMEILSMITCGSHIISSMLDLNLFLKNAGINICLGLAMALNMGAGRMDMSLGAQRLIACIIGGNIAMSLGLGPIPTLLVCVFFGALSGVIVGVVFVKTKVAPMILTLGMMLIYECVVFKLYPEGVHIYGNENFALLSNTTFIVVATIIVVAVLVFLLNYSEFGYNYKATSVAIQVAERSGVNVKKNIILTFAIAGVLIGMAGIFEASYIGTVESTLSMGSMEKVFLAFTPVLIGRILAMYSDTVLGTVSAVLMLRVLSQGLTVMKVESNTCSVINTAVLLAGFAIMTYLSQNKTKKAIALRKAEAEGT